MTFKTKKILNNNNFEQNIGDLLILSGDTYISSNGSLRYLTSPTITGNTQIPDVNYVTGLTSQINQKINSYTGTTVPNTYYNKLQINSYTGKTITEATNGLTKLGNTVILGGTLTGNTEILVNNNEFILSNIITNSKFISINGFDYFSGNEAYIYSIVLQPDNKILVGGLFDEYSGQTANRIIRLNNNGTIDNTFDISVGFNNGAFSIILQSDNKILVGGVFTTYSGQTANRIIKLNSDGTIDNTFDSGTGFNEGVNYITLQSDNKILVGGLFTTYSGQTANSIIRLNSDGTIDNTFDISVGFDNKHVYPIILQSDNKILVGGEFTTYSGQTANSIIRLNSDGTIDNTFDSGTGFNEGVYSIVLQPDNKILVGGSFTTYSGQTANNIIRLNSDGTIDNTFDISVGFGPAIIYSIALQSDNKILVGGIFTTYSGQTANNIIRLNSDGTIDNTFDSGTGFDSSTHSIILQSDNKILVGGDFRSYSGITAQGIIRLESNGYNDLPLESIITFKDYGLETNKSFSSYYTLRSIPDVDFVTGLTSQIATTASNGLTNVGNNIVLGGVLTGNTELTGNYTLSICSGAKINSTCGYQISGITIFRTANSTLSSIYLGQDSGLNSSGSNNIGIGYQALKSISTGYSNIAIGCQVLSGVTTEYHTVGIGNKALMCGGLNNIAIGIFSLNKNVGGSNVAIGPWALCSNDNGSRNIGIGHNSLRYNVSGINNIGIGYYTLGNNQTGCNNIAIGYETLRVNDGCNNIANGYYAMCCNSSGCDNIGFGYYSGYKNITGSSNVFIGKYAGYNETASNKLYIANQTGSTLIYGDFVTNIVTLPSLRLSTTPSVGVCTDSVLVWNSTDKEVKIVPYISGETISNATNGLTKSGTTVSLGGTITSLTTLSIASGNGLYISSPTCNSYFNLEPSDDYNSSAFQITSCSSASTASNTFNLGVCSEITSIIDANNCSSLYVCGNKICLINKNTSNSKIVELTSNGLTYSDNYTNQFIERSIPDIGWVTGNTSNIFATIIQITGTSYTLQNTDNNKILEFSNTGNTNLILPTGFTSGFNFTGVKIGSGNNYLRFTGGTGSNVYISDLCSKITKQYNGASAYYRGSNSWIAFGAFDN